MSERSLSSSRPSHPVHHHTAGFWALMSLLTFPLALVLFSALDVSVLMSFALAIMATCVVLFLNAVLENGMWMFHPRWQPYFQQPDGAFRLAVVSGALLLIVETGVMLYFCLVPGIDATMLSFVKYRVCSQPTETYQDLCQVLDR